MLERVEDFFRHPGPDAPKVDIWRAARRSHVLSVVCALFLWALVLAYGAPTFLRIMLAVTLGYGLVMTVVFTALLNRERSR